MTLTADPALSALFKDAWQEAGAPTVGVLAVSGGADSMALMAAAAHANLPAQFLVVSVDHGLRAEAADECRFVAAHADGLGLPQVTLTWRGDKPKSGLQENAREARYGLLASAAAPVGAGAIFTAHHADDVAETFLMRLARGGGAKALANMHTPVAISAGAGSAIPLVRPFLSIRRDALRRAAGLAGRDFLDDPSNLDLDNERVRMRAFLRDLANDLGLDVEAIAMSARRLAVTAAVEKAAEIERADALDLRFDDWGGLSIRAEFDPTIDQGLFARLVFAASGAEHAPTEDKCQKAMAVLVQNRTATLAGVVAKPFRGRVHFYREPAALLGRAGTSPMPSVSVSRGAPVLWDRRFIVTSQKAAELMPIGQLEDEAIPFAEGLARDAYRAAPCLRAADGVETPQNAPGQFRPLSEERFARNVLRYPVPQLTASEAAAIRSAFGGSATDLSSM